MYHIPKDCIFHWPSAGTFRWFPECILTEILWAKVLCFYRLTFVKPVNRKFMYCCCCSCSWGDHKSIDSLIQWNSLIHPNFLHKIVSKYLCDHILVSHHNKGHTFYVALFWAKFLLEHSWESSVCHHDLAELDHTEGSHFLCRTFLSKISVCID